MGVFAFFKKQKIEEGLDNFIGAAQNAFLGREDYAQMVAQMALQGKAMTGTFKVAEATLVQPKYEHLQQ